MYKCPWGDKEPEIPSVAPQGSLVLDLNRFPKTRSEKDSAPGRTPSLFILDALDLRSVTVEIVVSVQMASKDLRHCVTG
jgi:hypothetical protein